uniref:SH2 domain containing 4A n=1 Tax=Salvator merianae TaxID=96440 RepID=A0A8D0DTV2_SALMN
MLKQILADMYVDPELLAELSEEQKQILFFKMRQEQVRRWKEREAAARTPPPPPPPPEKVHGKSVQWKVGADGDVWVWVMGEHPTDKPYDLLCREILAERVKQQAVQEREAQRSPVEVVPAHPTTLPPHLLSDTHLELEIQKDTKNNMKWVNARNRESVQPPMSKSRDIQQMLADSINNSRKYGFQQKKEESVKTTMNERQMQEERILNHTSESMEKSDKEDSAWLESLRRSKAADERRRSIARHARDDYKRLSLQRAHKGGTPNTSKAFGREEKKQLVPPPLPPKPKNLTANGKPGSTKLAVQRSISSSTRESIIQWFKEEQMQLLGAFETSEDEVAPWFHGIISAQKAEELLHGSEPGSFLIRVSEKIKGYALSYQSAEGCKHFLIDASGESCGFLGVDQLQHSTLADLVTYHKDEPITSLGKERLRYPCGQQGQKPDYLDLFL